MQITLDLTPHEANTLLAYTRTALRGGMTRALFNALETLEAALLQARLDASDPTGGDLHYAERLGHEAVDDILVELQDGEPLEARAMLHEAIERAWRTTHGLPATMQEADHAA